MSVRLDTPLTTPSGLVFPNRLVKVSVLNCWNKV